MQFRTCQGDCSHQHEVDDLLACVAFQLARPPGTQKKRVRGENAIHDEDWLSMELDIEADRARKSGEAPCAIVYTKHLNGHCPGSLGGVSQAEADKFVEMGYARAATDDEIIRWLAQGCEDGTDPPLKYRKRLLTRQIQKVIDSARILNKDLALRQDRLRRKSCQN